MAVYAISGERRHQHYTSTRKDMDVRTCPCGLVVSGHDLDERVEALREGREQALLHSAIAMLPPGYRSPGMENEPLRDHEK